MFVLTLNYKKIILRINSRSVKHMYLFCQFIRYEIFLFLVSHCYVFCLAAGVLKTKYVMINVNIGNFRVCEGSTTLYTIKKD